MDLSTLNIDETAEKGADLQLLHPVDREPLLQEDGTPITIKLLGSDSKAYREISREISRKRMNSMARSRNKDVDFTPTVEQACDILSACTVGWKGVIVNGEKLKFSKEEAYKLYHAHSWIRDQVDLFIGDRANFFTSK